MFQSDERYYPPMWFQLHLCANTPICISIALTTLLDSVFESAYSTLLKFLIIPQILNSKTKEFISYLAPKGFPIIVFLSKKPVIQSEVSQGVEYHILTHTHTHMKSRKMVLMNLFARQQWRNRYREQI